MTALPATPERIIQTLEQFPDHIQKQFLIDRMAMYLGRGFIPDDTNPVGFRLVHMDNPEEAEELLQFKLKHLKKCKNNFHVFLMVNKPDRLQLLSFLSSVYTFSKKEYSELLRDSWVSTEFPHQLSNAVLVRMFDNADIQFLMTKEERKALVTMPDEIIVYRGYSETNVKKGMTKRRGLSWTLDKEKAIWFATRWKHPDANILRATVNKSDVYMYTDTRNESEVVVNPKRLKKVQNIGV